MTDWIEYFKIDDKYPKNDLNDKDKNTVLRFIFLWMKCNEFYNLEYKDIYGDKNKFLELKENIEIQNIYKQHSEEFIEKFEEIIPERRPHCYVININSRGKKVYYHKHSKRRLEDLLRVIYQIRCNFFHGEKEPTLRDIELIKWAYNCLNALLIAVD